MKKIALSLAALAVCSLSFTACEDVPAPYEVNDEGGTTTGSTIINESFSQSLGDFTALNTVGDISWGCSHGCAQITSYVDADGDGQKEDLAAESWLISPKMDFTSVDSAYVSFEYILRYANANEVKDNYQVLVSKDYTGIPTNATWTTLAFNATQGSDWDTWYDSGKLQIPDEFMKQPDVTLALRYKADKKAATWEVKNLAVKKGNGDEATDFPLGENLLSNSSFETWTNNLPEDWKSTTTASSAELAQSTDAHTGSSSVLVKGNETQNKRLASKEYTLKPGNYKMSLFVKGEGQVRPGYALIGDDGKIPSENGYVYGEYFSTVANEWTEVVYNFKLEAQTKVNFVMMNPKTSNYAKASDKLVDDFTLNTADGGLVEDGGTTPEPEQPEEPETPVGQSFVDNNGFETWTNNLPEGWKSTTTASSADLAQSTDAHTGSYSVLVKGNETQNKRLASKEYTLKPGNYKMSLFVKGEGQVRPGYTLIGDDGKIIDNGYKYGEYTSTVANGWTEVVYNFKLEAQTKVNFVMMNPKTSNYAKASDKLVDDFTVTTDDGGVVEEGGTTPEKPQPGGDLLNETFAKGQGNFTIDNKLLPEGASYIWIADAQYFCMKASAYINDKSWESESWLISPVVDLAASANPTLTFDHVANKGETNKMAEQNMLYIKAEGGEWTKMNITTYSPGNDWNAWTTSVQSLAAYKGKKIQFAFVYKTPQGSSGTWEVKNVVVR